MDLSTLLQVLKTAADGEPCTVDMTTHLVKIGNDYAYDGRNYSLEETIAHVIVSYPKWKSKKGCPHPGNAAFRTAYNPMRGYDEYGCQACGKHGLNPSDFT